MSGIFAAALGASRGLRTVAEDYVKESRRQEDLKKQFAMQMLPVAMELNDGATFDAQLNTLGVQAPGVSERLSQRHTAAEKRGRLQDESLQVGIDSQRHGMDMATKSLEQRRAEFAQTMDFQKLRAQVQDGQWGQEFGLRKTATQAEIAARQQSLGLQAKGLDLEAGRLDISRQELGLRKDQLALPGAGGSIQPRKGVGPDGRTYWFEFSPKKGTWENSGVLAPVDDPLGMGGVTDVPPGYNPGAPATPAPAAGGGVFNDRPAVPAAPAARPTPGVFRSAVPTTPAPAAPSAPRAGASYLENKQKATAPAAARPSAKAPRPGDSFLDRKKKEAQ